MERALTYFAADVHLGLDVADPAARERRFVDFLRGIDADRTEALYLLGDIWDFWYEWRDVVPKGYVRVFSALTDLMDGGVKVYFFRGNHDVWTYRYFEQLGMIPLEQPFLATIGGGRFCLGHGDGLGPAPRGYRVLRWIFHNRVLQALFSCLHPWIAFRLGNGWSRRNRLARREEYVFRGADEPIYKFSQEMASRESVDFFIFGHFHASVDLRLPSGARLLVLKDWMEGSPWVCFNSETGDFQ